MSMFANRFDKGAVGVVGDDMDNKMIHSDIKVGAEADKEDMGSLALSIEPKATAKPWRTVVAVLGALAPSDVVGTYHM